MGPTMRALTIDRYGGPEVLEMRDVSVPHIKPDQVLVRVAASSVNSWDCDTMRGTPAYVRMAGLFKPQVSILGGDFSGIVERVGDEVTRFKPGDAVIGDKSGAGWGGFAEFVASPEAFLAHKPDHVPFVDAAAIPQAGALALQSLCGRRKVEAGDEVLINGAGGGMGTYAIQIAKRAGARVTGVDSAAKADLMRELGADHVLDYRQTDYTTTGAQYDIIVDAVADKSPQDHLRSLKPGGTFEMVGGTIPALIQNGFFGNRVGRAKDCRIGLMMWRVSVPDMDRLCELYKDGVKPYVSEVFALEDGAEAMRQVNDGVALGKVVVNIAEL